MSRAMVGREGIVNVVVVTLVSLLIWMWAAGETRETESAFTDIRFEAPTSDSIRIRPGEVETLRLQVRGPRRAVDTVAERLRDPVTVVAGTDGVPSEPGRHQIDLAELVDQVISQWRLPVTVVGAEPATVEVEIVRLDTREVRISPILPPGVRTSGKMEVTPEVATIVLPGDLADIEQLELEARIADRDLEGREAGRRHRILVPLQLPDGLVSFRNSIRIEPQTVEVGLSLESNEAELTLAGAVPVQIAGPAEDLDDRIVEVDPTDAFLRNVVVRGPSDAIERLRAREDAVGVIAFVHLTDDDLLQRISEKPVTLWNLPPGVVVTSVDGDATSNPRVAVLIRDRTDPPAPQP